MRKISSCNSTPPPRKENNFGAKHRRNGNYNSIMSSNKGSSKASYCKICKENGMHVFCWSAKQLADHKKATNNILKFEKNSFFHMIPYLVAFYPPPPSSR